MMNEKSIINGLIYIYARVSSHTRIMKRSFMYVDTSLLQIDQYYTNFYLLDSFKNGRRVIKSTLIEPTTKEYLVDD